MIGKLHQKVSGEWIVLFERTIKNCFGCKSYIQFKSLPLFIDNNTQLIENKEVKFEVITIATGEDEFSIMDTDAAKIIL
jgi:uncharacterized membrane protein